jgi:hypothetical protein
MPFQAPSGMAAIAARMLEFTGTVTENRAPADPAEHLLHRAVPQQAHVVDRVGARGRPGGQARDFQARVRTAVAARADVRGGEAVQPGALGEAVQRDKARV